MTTLVKGSDLTRSERTLLFWASFLALAAAGFGFAFRVAMGGAYKEVFHLTNHQVGQVFGATLWPIALTMIGFSLVVDRTGYKWPMVGAFVLQAASGIGTYFADSYLTLYLAALCAGLGHGIVEAVINPVCAAVYPHEKTKRLTILHAAWPAGLMFGTLAIILAPADWSWKVHALWILLPAGAYFLMYLPCKFPVDERVQAGVPYRVMLKQLGFLGAALTSFLLTYEIGRQSAELGLCKLPANWFSLSIYFGLGFGAAFGIAVRAVGQPLFFLLCVLMIPIATVELGTDGWIKNLMAPVLESKQWNPALGLVFSAAIMLVFRVFAGGILRRFSPPTLLCLSGLFSAVGLYWLSGATGIAIFVAFVIYALGQTYYWPCVLGFTSERYPQGGALTLNTVSAIGLLSAGIIGTQVLGVAFDRSTYGSLEKQVPALARVAAEQKSYFGYDYMAVLPVRRDAFLVGTGQKKVDPKHPVASYTPEERSAFDAGRGLPAAEKAGLTKIIDRSESDAGRDALTFASTVPLVLVLAFGLIALYFRVRGGYRPIQLGAADH
ncbi:MAG: MFS transporter [Planctomycetes bacterium]|nr:MFS transporter [Planctomycetota bacterium]MCB9870231.1 MFS transporter [Planctomycetota bacterium]